MLDLTTAMTDPNIVIVIPGRGTTNTLTGTYAWRSLRQAERLLLTVTER